MSDQLNKKVVSATKWSSITEIIAKLVAPITTVVLARLLTPDDFGVLVTAQMVISFAEIFTDAGFQKYLIQYEFKSDGEKYNATNVAFWSNFALSVIIFLFIIVLSSKIADLVGCEGKEFVIVAASVCIPIGAFSSIQTALFKRNLDFKTLFLVRMIGLVVPLIITIPLAFFTRSYWALIIGMIALNLSNAIVLSLKSKWKPQKYFSFTVFKKMFSFTMWTLIEAISIWLTAYIDIFIVGTLLSQHYLGIYRTSMSTVGQIVGIVVSATTPVLFSSLSRLQNNEDEFEKMFFRFQKIVGLLIVPIGVGIFLFRDFITSIFLGDQWIEAAYFMGLWGLTSTATIILSHYCSEVYRAKGRPKLSVLAQWLHIIVLWPAVYISINYDFQFLCNVRALVRLELVLVNLIIMTIFIKISVLKMVKNILPSLIAGSSMFLVVLLPTTTNIGYTITYGCLSVALYFGTIMCFSTERNILLNIKSILKR